MLDVHADPFDTELTPEEIAACVGNLYAESLACLTAALDEARDAALAPDPIISFKQWLLDRAELPGIESDIKGKFEPFGYQLAWAEFLEVPGKELYVSMTSARVGKTQLMTFKGLKSIENDRASTLLLQPTEDDAKDYVKSTVDPTIACTPCVADIMGNADAGENEWGTKYTSKGSVLRIRGAFSADTFRRLTVKEGHGDELDAAGWDNGSKSQGDKVDLLRERGRTLPGSRVYLWSTPTTIEHSRIYNWYLLGDRYAYFVPCPHCGEFQTLEFGGRESDYGVKWPKDDPEAAYYVCRHNGCEILEHHKPEMLAGGAWDAQAPGAGGGRARGFHLSSLYSPLGWLSWRDLVSEWHKAITLARAGDTTLLRVFVNTRLAETYEEQGERADAHALQRRAEAYALRTVPWGGLIVTGSTDVQGDRLECYAVAWGRGEEAWLVDRQVFYGDPSIAEGQDGSLWDKVTEWRRTPLLHAGGAELRIQAHAVDSGGHHTQMVYSYARRHAHAHVLAIKGSSTRNGPVLGKPSDVEINHRGQRLKKGTRLWPIGTDTAKTLLSGRLRLERPGSGFMHFSNQLPGEFYEQLTAERLVSKHLRGRVVLEWVCPGGKRNEATDCAVYCIAMAHYLGIHRYTEVHWQRLEQHVRQVALFSGVPAPAPEPADEAPEDKPEVAARDTLAPESREPQAPPTTGALAPPAKQAPAPPAAAQDRRPVRRGGWFPRKW